MHEDRLGDEAVFFFARNTARTMWDFLGRLFGSRGKTGSPGSIDAVFRDLDQGAAERPKPTLVCRTCGLKYENTGTFLQGSACPRCRPAG